MSEAKRIEENEVIGELIRVEFPMYNKPAAVQLTVHVTNIIETIGKRKAIKEFKALLNGQNPTSNTLAIRQVVNYYGIKYCRQWFNEIYGWEFKKEAV